MIDASDNPRFQRFMAMADRYRTMGVRTNADTAADALVARKFGAEGIGLFRTEHMFYGEGSDEPLFHLRRMILSRTPEERRAALDSLFPFVKASLKGTMEVMEGYAVTIRLLDPPLHEFVPQGAEKQNELAEALGIPLAEIQERGEQLHESNPMMGHRGIRLGVTYPEISEMQIRAIFECAAELIKAGKRCTPEIMVPVTCDVSELEFIRRITERVHGEVLNRAGLAGLAGLEYKFGTMIEIPRAALMADRLAESSMFFSFGTNDLTQMTFGFSRDDIGSFLHQYLDLKLLKADPFETIDQEGVGQLIRIGVEKGRATRPELKVGICGEQGGDPASVEFCYRTGLNYVSCSPYRVPIARLAAAHAALKASL
jgi:pyruvate,orthophosphate dikinase